MSAGSITSDKWYTYNKIAGIIRYTTTSGVYLKGSRAYEKRRHVHNGACANIYPDLVVVPKSTSDVSTIVSVAREYQVPISVRSGGHSYLCQGTRPGNYICRGITRVLNLI